MVVKAPNGHQLYTLKSSDHAYRIFIEQMTIGAVTLNRAGEILYCNSQFATTAGLSLEKVSGRHFSEFFAPDNQNSCADLMDRAWKDKCKAELLLLSAGGQEIPVLLSMQTLDLEEGLAMSVIVTDLSLQKEQQQLLQEKNSALEQAQHMTEELNANLERTVQERTRELYANQERLSRILETMAEGVGIIDTKGQLTYANPMAQKILGLEQSEIKERTYDDPKWQNLRIDGSALPDDEHPMAIMMKTGQPVYDHEIAVQPTTGDRFYISINAAPIRDEQGEIIAGIGTFMDVTNRRKAMQQKDEFISVASHELRTPITSLKASLQLLERMKDSPSSAMLPRLIEQSNKSLNKVSVLVNDLLNATKLTEGQVSLKKDKFRLSDLLENCCHHIRMDGNYEILCQGDNSLIVEADRDKIDQVLDNLVNNAVKYAPASKHISIQYYKDGDMVKVSVADKGPGIPPEKLPHLFERYYRVDSGGHQYSGLGLGLYICSEIIKRHGGQIGVHSAAGNGTTFWFTLPLSVTF
nr:ATP-binding protein [Mucilaginibacter sp. Bleaf8]